MSDCLLKSATAIGETDHEFSWFSSLVELMLRGTKNSSFSVFLRQHSPKSISKFSSKCSTQLPLKFYLNYALQTQIPAQVFNSFPSLCTFSRPHYITYVLRHRNFHLATSLPLAEGRVDTAFECLEQ